MPAGVACEARIKVQLGDFELRHVKVGGTVPGDEPADGLHACLPADPGEVGAHAVFCSRGEGIEVDVVGERLAPGVDCEDRPASGRVGEPYLDLQVKPAGSQQCRVQYVGAVSGRQGDDPAQFLDSVELGQELAYHPLGDVVPAPVAPLGASASISSRNTMQGAACRAFL